MSRTVSVAAAALAALTDVEAEDTGRWDAQVTADGVTFRTDEPVPDGMRDEAGGGGVSRDDLDMPGPVIVVTAADGSPDREAAMSYGAAGLLGVACLGSGVVLLLRRRRA